MKYGTNNPQRASNVGAVVVCAGKGERSGLPYNKVLHCIGRKTVLETTLDAFLAANVTRIVAVVSESDEARIRKLTAQYKGVSVCLGGNSRGQSVLNGLKALDGCDIVAIHDGARPFVTAKIITDSIAAAEKYGSGIVAVPVTDTIKSVENDYITRSLPRSELYAMQTPQTFLYDKILAAYESTRFEDCTDDAEVFARAGHTPHIVNGSYDNIKITTASDLFRVFSCDRIGAGFDVHRLESGRPLYLGGAEIPYDKGLLGHSDADVLIHAVMDALLSAAGLPDIGVLFPDTDDEYLGIRSTTLLEKVCEKIKGAGYGIINVSAVVIAQQPKLAPHIKKITESIADTIGATPSQVNVSATTTEHLGIIGNGDAIAASASCLLRKL